LQNFSLKNLNVGEIIIIIIIIIIINRDTQIAYEDVEWIHLVQD
jgi:hypothetical protein